MNRREMLRLVGAALAIPSLAALSPEQLLALGRRIHRQAGPRVLDPTQNRIVTTVAEHIIPATDTPGATAARVHEFIDLIVAEWYADDERARFLQGLADVDAKSQDRFGKPFLEATPSEQIALLGALDDEVAALRDAGDRETARRHFFQQMKHLTLWGYYTSEVGVEQELHYVMIPGRYDSCAAAGLGNRGGD
ncbi:MAG: gluconate 2-dehydrogenase subunit 3 family protein [Gemmatimonadetes bacterium]|nr:gluconate 2-dehydrogenase subunit 3 family protein [Gemmatimonadota bacterium]MBI3082727.1 gluconate 2-dehydrogenase subunit 3 family protein [Gemmatimonadota bacterium]